MTTVLNKPLTLEKSSDMRYSGVELLRIVAILFIIWRHSLQTAMKIIDMSSLTFFNVLLSSTTDLGEVGNALFVICSSYFLADSKGAKPEKAIKILLDSMSISVFIFICMTIAGYRFSNWEIVWQFLPDIKKNVWFVPDYVMFYLLHPIINYVLNKTDKKQHVALIVATICIDVFLKLLSYSTPLVEFIAIFVIVSYLKKHQPEFCNDKKTNLIIFFVSLSVYIAWMVTIVILKMPDWMMLWFLYAPTTLPWTICMFNLFRMLKIKSKTINYLSSCSLFVYCIHENILLRTFIRPKYYDFVLGISYDLYPVWILLCFVGMFIGSFLLSIAYKETWSRLTRFVATKCKQLVEKIFDSFKIERA